eukprot:49416_1
MHSPSKSIVKHRGNLKEHCIKTDQKEDDEQRIEGYLRVYLMAQTLFQTTCLHHKKSIKQCRNTRQTRVIIIHFFLRFLCALLQGEGKYMGNTQHRDHSNSNRMNHGKSRHSLMHLNTTNPLSKAENIDSDSNKTTHFDEYFTYFDRRESVTMYRS